MKVHELKTWPDSFEAVILGEKRHEFRMDDGRGFEVGDELCLREFAPCKKCAGSGRVRDYNESEDCGCPKPYGRYTGDVCRVKVTYVTKDVFDVPSGYVVMSIVKKPNWNKPWSSPG